MKNKLEVLQEAINHLQDAVDRMPITYGTEPVFIDLFYASILAESLKSLRLVNVFEGFRMRRIGEEYISIPPSVPETEAAYFLETVGVIRLKDENDES